MKITTSQVIEAFDLVKSVAELIRIVGSIPSGHLYADLMTRGITLDQYTSIIRTLKDSGLVTEEFHELHWQEPTTQPMKTNIPSTHSQLGLPIGSRVRFNKGSEQIVGHIAGGAALDENFYWIRPLHRSTPVRVHRARIKFIEYIPGAPQPTPRKWGEAFVNMAGKVERYFPCPPPQPRRVIPYDGNDVVIDPPVPSMERPLVYPFYAPLPPPPPLPAHPGALPPPPPLSAPTQPKADRDVLEEIARGGFDDILSSLSKEVHARILVVRAKKRRMVVASLTVGDRVKIVGGIKPRYMVGVTGVIKAIGTTRVDVTFDSALPRFGKGAKVPANCIEKLS